MRRPHRTFLRTLVFSCGKDAWCDFGAIRKSYALLNGHGWREPADMARFRRWAADTADEIERWSEASKGARHALNEWKRRRA
jgi:hypothetical protein